MPIKIPDNLPARAALESEGVMVMREADAVRQDIRPLRIALLNLMPNKPRTETQFARLLAASPLQIELSLVQMTGHAPRNTPAEHMSAFYRTWAEACVETFDGLIVTGAPVENLPFEQVTYWDELRRIFDWTQTHVHSCLNICWSAQAALYHFHGAPKRTLPAKRFGVFQHRNLAPASPYLRGFSDDFCIPVSRWAEVRREDLPRDSGLSVLAESDEAGLCLLDDPARRALHMFNHVEYDSITLAEEYFRDLGADPETPLPRNYFPGDDPMREPANRWRSHAHLLFGNWINQIYQTTPFDLRDIGR
ncbi:MAG TPA: homoserine O-succinyltransferase [Phenylobacterium sp.]|uniref:homoserine O-succinyltransferase n=1 Tax=Phenylobacterium sp. TaxID=1871053 RepID=UPI002B49BD7D|nr:homoserine O-succinyltransferase [Phenylobacterium sp.]HKR88861.1 homoserine O-succinyltransferase [Phenylobacterium sp.]